MPRDDGVSRHELGVRGLIAMVGRFASVGAICAAANFMIMFVSIKLVGINYVKAALLACMITVPLSYFVHRRVTFRISSAWQGEAAEFLRFVVSQLVQFGVGLCVLIGLVDGLGFAPMWGMVVMTGLMFAYGFAVNSTWVFKALKGGRPRPL
jgi:putative flippase GtrA